MAALLAVALAAGIVTVSAPHVMAMLSAASKPDGLGAAGNPEGLGAAGNLDALRVPGNAPGRPEPCAAPAGGAVPAGARPVPCPATAPPRPRQPANVNCEIIVPAHPLSAAGLATPYRLTGTDGASPAASGCTMANSANLGESDADELRAYFDMAAHSLVNAP